MGLTCVGPSKLPELGRELGKSVKSFQTAAKVCPRAEKISHALSVLWHNIPTKFCRARHTCAHGMT